jgi:uncharacterized protein (TIGR02118 family)
VVRLARGLPALPALGGIRGGARRRRHVSRLRADGEVPANAVKNIEFVNRRAGMALEPFRSYWRNVHGPLAAKISSIRRYEQNHLALGEYEKAASPPYDGLAITWFASTAEMRSGAATAEYAATRADEANFLPGGHLPIIITREHVVV